MKIKNKAFTLTELLVVVIVLGVLAAVAAPKFTRILETRRTTEAEDLLSAVRTEQEYRCLMGKDYTLNAADVPLVSSAKSKNYALDLQNKGAVATRGDNKNYELRILYNSGKLCCSGEGCNALNKDYEPCEPDWGNLSDECATTGGGDPVPPPADPCVTNPNDCECSTYASAHQCECMPSTSTCCEEGQTWNDQTKECDKVCVEKTEYIGSSSASETDSCDGDTSAKYSCDGVFNGTCVDVYKTSGLQVALASYVLDPFVNFVQDVSLMAAATGIYCPKECKNGCIKDGVCATPSVGDGLAPGGQYCQQGYSWDAQKGTCVYVGTGTHRACDNGQYWNEATQQCEGLQLVCKDGEHWDSAAKTCVPDEHEIAQACDEGCIWNASLNTCICLVEIAKSYSKRSVTCCGTGGSGGGGIQISTGTVSPNYCGKCETLTTKGCVRKSCPDPKYLDGDCNCVTVDLTQCNYCNGDAACFQNCMFQYHTVNGGGGGTFPAGSGSESGGNLPLIPSTGF